MKKILFIAAIAATALFVSCSEDSKYSEIVENEVLNVNPLFEDQLVTKATISSFPAGSEIGLFVTSGTLGNNYDGISSNSNVKSSLSGSSWVLSPFVYLSNANAQIFAYYPYKSTNTSGLAIPLEHTTQTDYLYGTHTASHPNVNNGSPNVSLAMKHALTLVQFKLNKNNYTGKGVVTEIEIRNKTGKTSLSSEGTMNIQTGTITKTTGKNVSAKISNSSGLCTLSTTAPTNETLYQKIMTLPISALAAAGDIEILFTIDGKVYTHQVAASTVWNSGTKNTYTVTLSGTALVVQSVTIQDWTNGISGSVVLQ